MIVVANQPAVTSLSRVISLAQILENGVTQDQKNGVTQDQMNEWLSSPTRDIHARLVHFTNADSRASSVYVSAPSIPLSFLSSSSMVPAYIHQSSSASPHPPSLYHYSDVTPTETSISTGLASRFSGVPLLEEIDGVLERRPNTIRQPTYECSFWFLSCSYSSYDKEEWRVHNLSHFEGEEPPRSVICPLCEHFVYTCGNGWISWDYRQEHVAYHHEILGETLRRSRPDFHLFQHLWQKRLIGDQDLKELKGGNHNLTRSPSDFTIKNGRRGRDARHRGQRHQHVGASRAYPHIPTHVRKDDKPKQGKRQQRLQGFVPSLMVTGPNDRPEISTSTVGPQHTIIQQSHSTVETTNRFPDQTEGHQNLELSLEGTTPAPDQLDLQRQNIRSSAIFPSKSVQLSPSSQNVQGSDSVSDSFRCDSDTIFTSKPILLSIYSEGDQVSDSVSDSVRSDSDIVEDAESSDGAVEPHLSVDITETTKEQYQIRLLQSFYENRRRLFTECTTDQENGQESSGTSRSKHRATSPPDTDDRRSKSSKRSRWKHFDKEDQENEDDENRRAAPGSTPPNRDDNSKAKELLFACPFVKRYPQRYLKCFSHTLKDISRVKQHLFRDKTHRLPIYCPNCSGIFGNELLRDEHIRDVRCEKKPVVKWEGITESQRRQLSKRSPSTRTPEANWFAIFEILFPGDPLPVDPYIDVAFSGELRAFREHLLVEGPRIWNDVLTTQLPEHLRQYVEELQSLYDSFYAESIVRLCESWHAQGSSDCKSGTWIEPEDETVSTRLPLTTSQSILSHPDTGHIDYRGVGASLNVIPNPPFILEYEQSAPDSHQIPGVSDNMKLTSTLEEPPYLQDASEQRHHLIQRVIQSETPHLAASSLEPPNLEFHLLEASLLDPSQTENAPLEPLHHQENPRPQDRASNAPTQSPKNLGKRPRTPRMHSMLC